MGKFPRVLFPAEISASFFSDLLYFFGISAIFCLVTGKLQKYHNHINSNDGCEHTYEILLSGFAIPVNLVQCMDIGECTENAKVKDLLFQGVLCVTF